MHTAANSLLPSGFFDLLPPDARRQRLLYQHALDCFASFGYQEVTPPLMEFETSLLGGKTGALAAGTFRLMEPLSREMMGIRSDMTLQVARIAAARLNDQPLPLRLCYAGTCVRVAGEGLRRERQFMQAGAELIGSEAVAADIEILRMAVEALTPLSLGEITLDLNLPGLTAALLEELPEDLRTPCAEAVRNKDRSSLASHDHPLIPAIVALLDGKRPPLPPKAAALLAAWEERIAQLQAAGIPARLSFDPLEQRGFEYHTELAFSIFAAKAESEIGRGGRYRMEDGTPAIGFTLYLNPLRHAMRSPLVEKKCYLPFGTPPEISARLRSEGWIVVQGLEPTHDTAPLGCTHRWDLAKQQVAALPGISA